VLELSRVSDIKVVTEFSPDNNSEIVMDSNFIALERSSCLEQSLREDIRTWER
jgi:hypothetical protein